MELDETEQEFVIGKFRAEVRAKELGEGVGAGVFGPGVGAGEFGTELELELDDMKKGAFAFASGVGAGEF